MSSTPRLVLGTNNPHKRSELAEMLAGSIPGGGIEVATLADFANAIEVEETGTTFAENSRLKAVEQAKHLGEWVLADDSGIAIDALKGRPGVDSAHFAGPQRDNDANNQLVLDELAGVPRQRRGAKYVCHVVLADPAGEVQAEAVGTCRGEIATELRGSGGFGYDPLFIVREYHRTFGELGPAVKQTLSHRSRALRTILPDLVRLLAPR
ncbi:MAG: RdgB/HAM1 family non-canonical purine NTP pyrophosphatase [Planctomycetota bacterium]